jgi:hypothetical protein
MPICFEVHWDFTLSTILLVQLLWLQAGTVLTWQDAERAKEAGVTFLMSPVTDKVLHSVPPRSS